MMTGKSRVTSMLVIQFMNTDTPVAELRILLGNSSESMTHMTGPGPPCMPIMKMTMTPTARYGR